MTSEPTYEANTCLQVQFIMDPYFSHVCHFLSVHYPLGYMMLAVTVLLIIVIS